MLASFLGVRSPAGSRPLRWANFDLAQELFNVPFTSWLYIPLGGFMSMFESARYRVLIAGIASTCSLSALAQQSGPTACDIAFGAVESGAVAAAIDPALQPGKFQRIVLTFADAAARDAALERVRLANFLPVDVARDAYAMRHLNFVVLPALTVSTDLLDQLAALGRDLGLISVSTDPEVRSLIDSTGPLIGVNAARAAFGEGKEPAGYTVTGDGIGVAVLDTGWDKTQGDFEHLETFGNVRMVGPQAIEFVPPVENSETNQGHGTHIVGTIAGNGAQSDGRIVGLAPQVNMLSVAVDAGASYAFLLDGFDYVLEVQDDYNIRVTNHSYGPAVGSAFRFDPSTASSQAIRAFYQAGIIPVFAAGNAGPDEDTISADAQNPCAIGVAAGTRALTLTDFSSRGRSDNAIAGPDITAPGDAITASRAINGFTSTSIPDLDNPAYATISGTSMAAPHVVASIALILEADESLSFEDVYELITSTATPMKRADQTAYEPFEVGFGYIDTAAAIAKLLGEQKPERLQPVECPAPGESSVINFAATAAAVYSTPAVSFSPSGFEDSIYQFLLEPSCALASMTVEIEWSATLPEDIDLELIGPEGGVIGASTNRQLEEGAEPSEAVTIESAGGGLYTSRVFGYRNNNLPYTGTVTLVAEQNINTAPVAALSVPATAGVDEEITVSAAASSDPDGDALNYQFDLGDGTQTTVSTSPTVTHRYATAGDYVVTVTVSDASGATDSASQTITVAEDGGGNTAGPGSTIDAVLAVSGDGAESDGDAVNGDAETVFTFDASGSGYTDAEGSDLHYTFVFGDEASEEEYAPTTSDPIATHSYGAAGTYEAYVIVSDAFGNSDTSNTVTITTTITITVEGDNGTVAQLTVDETSGPAPLQVVFDGSQSFTSEGETITEYCFDFDDGEAPQCGTEDTATYVYTRPGSYEPSLMVTASDESTATAKATVSVGGTGSNPGTPSQPAASTGGGSGALGGLLLLPLLGFGLARRRG